MRNNNNLRCDSFWGGYGFSFKVIYNEKKKRYSKWYMVLSKLFLTPMTKDQLWNSIDYRGYNNSNICKRSWNSYVLSALSKEGYIYYDRATKMWDITTKGRAKFAECVEEIKESY